MSAVLEVESNVVDQNIVTTNAVVGGTPEVLTRIYDEQTNIVVMERGLSNEINQYCQRLVEDKPNLNIRSVVNCEKAVSSLNALLPDLDNKSAFIEDISLLIDMYSYLFELEEVGLRLEVLDRAMCPRFHIDKLGCRLVTTYKGVGTEWLYNQDVDRSKLGAGSKGLADLEAGLYAGDAVIQKVNEGDVVLLKGEGWHGNEGLGAVHRSPAVAVGDKRIVITMDFA